MISKKMMFITLVILILLIFGFIPTKYLVKIVFNKESADEKAPVSQTVKTPPVKKTIKAKTVVRKIDSPKTTSIKPEKPLKAAVKKAVDKKPKEVDEVDKIDEEPAVKQLAKESLPEELAFDLFDPMENKARWKVGGGSSGNTNLGIYRGIDGKAIAIFYNLKKGERTEMNREGVWDLTAYKGFRFACKMDGSIGLLVLELENSRGEVVKKSWTEKDLKGSSWKVFSMIFEEAAVSPEKGKPARQNIIKVKFKVAAEENDIKGRVVIDNLEFIK